MDWEAKQIDKTLKGLHYKTKDIKVCPDCKYRLCTCQSILQDYNFEVTKPLKDLTMAQKIRNCPQNCLNRTTGCLSCHSYDKFKMDVKL